MDRLVIDAVHTEEVQYWMHYAVHFERGSIERQAAGHFEESLLRVIRQRDRIRTMRRSLRINGITGWIDPTAAEQHDLFDATQTFFENVYACLSAFAAFCART